MTGELFRLSPYCVFWMVPDGKSAQIANGLHGSRFEIAADLLRVLIELSEGATYDAVLARAPEGAGRAIPTLVEEKILVPASQADEWVASDPFRNRLQPIELAFHRGVNEGGYFADVDRSAIPAPAKAARGGATIPLRTRDGSGDDAALATILARRRSIRAFGEKPLRRSDLERFLELAARAHALRESPGLGWVSQRHYPSGGARYPLEIYPVVYNVESLPEGIYHYRPFAHCLEAIASDRELRERLVAMALGRMAPEARGRPSVLFLITAVFERTCWKYRGMPYHAILMEVGALYQTMYLAAATLGLAPCAIGAFPELATAELLGIDSRDEAQVGMFALGVKAVDRPEFPAITALREAEASPFASGGLGRAVELTFADGSQQIVTAAGLALDRDGAGRLQCRFLHREGVAVIAEACRDDALRLLEGRGPATS